MSPFLTTLGGGSVRGFGRSFRRIIASASGFKLFSWGGNYAGQLGVGARDTVSPYSGRLIGQVGSLTTWASISITGELSFGIKTDGTLWAWGNNSTGQLGLPTLGYYTTPTQVGSDTNWKQTSLGINHSLAIKTNGTLWGVGQSGDNALTNNLVSSNPTSFVQLDNGTSWAYVFAGQGYSFGIKTDGTLWGWGLNDKFQNGTSGYAPYGGVGTITQAAGGNYVKAVGQRYWGVAIRTDGTLQATGENINGENGVGYATQTLFGSTQVGTGITHADIAATSQGTLGVTTSGQVTATGNGRVIYPYSGAAQRGFGNIYMDGSGTTLAGVAKIAANNNIGYVIKTTGTLWAWGQNNAFDQGNNAGNGSCFGPVESGVFGNSSYLRTDTYTSYYNYCCCSDVCYNAATDETLCYNNSTGECNTPFDVGSTQASLNCYKDYQPTAVQIGSSTGWAKLPDTNGFNTNHAIALQS
jgi:alpha-tubulin suppressor-like RCC1 family protein